VHERKAIDLLLKAGVRTDELEDAVLFIGGRD
jgi:hypothetical protein